MEHRRDDFRQRSRSGRSWYDDFEDRYFGDVSEAQHSNDFSDEYDDHICTPSRPRGYAKRNDHESSQGFATEKETASAVKPCLDGGSRTKILKKVAPGWTEQFSTISEHPTMELAEQDTSRSLSHLKSLNTSTPTHRMSAVAGRCSSNATMQAHAATTVCESKEILALCPAEEMLEPVLFTEAFMAPTLTKEIVESGSKESCCVTLAQAEEVRPVDADEYKEGVPAYNNAFGTPSRVAFGNALSAFSTRREETPTQDILQTTSTICGKFGYGSPARSSEEMLPYEERLVPYVNLPPNETVQGHSRMPALFMNLIDVERWLHPDRGCILVLIMGLMVSVFVVASIFTVRVSFRLGLLSDKSSDKAANAEVTMNATNVGVKTHTPHKYESAATVRLGHVTSTASEYIPMKQGTLFTVKGRREHDAKIPGNASDRPWNQLTKPSSSGTNRTVSAAVIVSLNQSAFYDKTKSLSAVGSTSSTYDDGDV
ncbi:hypothetical protein V5799_020738 [Amblyomma americanum]|uniref:Transmembrane protein n=1 Tax=Amblyomma americanum TaxID=6943 RepID=A0AAQ4ET49_AMBAM